MAIYLITGASSGIGEELSRQAAAKGHTVYGVARRAEVLQKLAAGLGGLFVPVVVDVSDKAAVGIVCGTLPALPDKVILNAGVGENESRQRFDVAIHERTFAVNYFGAMNFVDALLPAFLKRGSGEFVAISSLTAYKGLPRGAAYSASKAALSNTFESLRVTYGWSGVRFLTVHPGFVDTPMQKGQKMVFMLPVKKAADIILQGIEKGRTDISFPLLMRLAILSLVHMPDWLYVMAFRQKKPDR